MTKKQDELRILSTERTEKMIGAVGIKSVS